MNPDPIHWFLCLLASYGGLWLLGRLLQALEPVLDRASVWWDRQGEPLQLAMAGAVVLGLLAGLSWGAWRAWEAYP